MGQTVLVPGFPTWKRVSNPRSVRVGFVVDTVALWQVSLPVLLFPPVSIIPPTVRIHLYLNTTVIRTSRHMWEPFAVKILTIK
jgi:hypothetical protein